jgi:hypothetical protein
MNLHQLTTAKKTRNYRFFLRFFQICVVSVLFCVNLLLRFKFHGRMPLTTRSRVPARLAGRPTTPLLAGGCGFDIPFLFSLFLDNRLRR